MAELIIMPKLGFNMSEGKLVAWYKKEGEAVTKGEPLFSIETDKTNMDIEATGDGVVRRLFIGEGESLPVTLPIAIVGSTAEDISALEKEALQQIAEKAPDAVPKDAGITADAGGAAAAPAAQQENNAAYDYDIIVIGGGPGGYVAAIQAAQLGKKVMIAEKEHFGGTCLNIGCIPTKALLRSAEALKQVQSGAAFGVVGADVKAAKLDMKAVQQRKSDVVNQLVGGVKGLLKSNGVEMKTGEAVFAKNHEVRIAGESYTAQNVVIATGSENRPLPIEIDPAMDVLSSTEMLALEELPASMAVIGGGVIGMEFAEFLAMAGTKVTVLEYMDRILPMVDEEITEMVTSDLMKDGIEIITGAKVTGITANSVCYEKDGKEQEIPVEKVLMATGRGSRLDGIDTAALGLKVEKGSIITDAHLRTSVPDVYCIGDANGKAMLAHTAMMEGITAAENMAGRDTVMEYHAIPSVIYVHPEIASVGLTEAQAREKYSKVNIGKFPLMANGKAKIEGDTRGMVKVIADADYGEILGVHIYGVHAADMIAESAVAMNLEATVNEVARTVHPHPSISEIMGEAMHAVGGRAIHF